MKQKVKIYMENGTVLEHVADYIKSEFNTGTGKLVRLNWEGMVPNLNYIDLNRVTAVVVEDS